MGGTLILLGLFRCLVSWRLEQPAWEKVVPESRKFDLLAVVTHKYKESKFGCCMARNANKIENIVTSDM
jgi:hypothetical protein